MCIHICHEFMLFEQWIMVTNSLGLNCVPESVFLQSKNIVFERSLKSIEFGFANIGSKKYQLRKQNVAFHSVRDIL